MERLLRVLNTIQPLPANLSDDLSKITVRLACRKGEIVKDKGTPCEYAYYIEKGLICSYETIKGKTISHWFQRDGKWIIYPDYLRSVPDSVSTREVLEAMEDSVLLGIPCRHLQHMYKTTPEINHFYRLSNRFFASVFYDGSYSGTYRDNYNTLLKKERYLLSRAPLSYLAGYINVPEWFLQKMIKNREVQHG